MGKTLLALVGVLIAITIAAFMFLSGGQTQEAPAPSPETLPPPKPPEEVPWRPDGVISEGEYEGSAEFSGGRFKVYWRVEGGYLYMALEGMTEGWVAIGFEPTKMMKDADMVIGLVEDGEVKVLDTFSTGEIGPHPPDEKLGGRNDIEEFGGREAGGVTIIEFKRKLDTGDRYDKPITPGRSIRIIYAMADVDDFKKKHNVAKGSGELAVGG